MGVTPLLTNSQGRDFCPYLFKPINNWMNVNFIDKIEKVYVNINRLLLDYTLFKDNISDVVNHDNKVLVQRKFHLILNNINQCNLDATPYTKDVIELLKPYLNFDSVTYRFVMPNTCYNWHQDTGQNCLHIPLITNLGCRFVYENRAFYMPADGSVYYVNNSKLHTFVNAGSEPRLHLTFETL